MPPSGATRYDSPQAMMQEVMMKRFGGGAGGLRGGVVGAQRERLRDGDCSDHEPDGVTRRECGPARRTTEDRCLDVTIRKRGDAERQRNAQGERGPWIERQVDLGPRE